ncbi:MAG: hypothetical protein QM726_10055 [Chitinophagaceae bacterium]
MFKIDFDYRKGSAATKELRAVSVLQNMKDNAFFPDQPALVMADLAKLQQQFSQSRVDAENRDRQKSAVKNNVAKELVKCLDAVAKYVTDKANGDDAILLSAGFKITSDSAADFGPIENFKVRNGKNSGEVIVSCKAVEGADSYVFHYAVVTADGVLQWKHIFITACKTTIKDSDLGKNHAFYMEAIGSNQRSVKSEQLTKYVS